MAEAATVASASDVKGDRSFLWRRLHSLSGVVPVGGYLCYHLFENLTALKGKIAYDEMVNHVNTMLPRAYFHLIELALVIGPLLYHSLYGLYVAGTGQANVGRYSYPSNWAYWAQRVTGYVAFVYILVHVGVLRVWVTLMGNHLAPTAPLPEGRLDLVTYQDVAAHLGRADLLSVKSAAAGPHIFLLYLVGTILTIYHFTNGLNGFCWTWGIAVGRTAQRRVQAIAWALFAAMSFATLNILFEMRFGG